MRGRSQAGRELHCLCQGESELPTLSLQVWRSNRKAMAYLDTVGLSTRIGTASSGEGVEPVDNSFWRVHKSRVR